MKFLVSDRQLQKQLPPFLVPDIHPVPNPLRARLGMLFTFYDCPPVTQGFHSRYSLHELLVEPLPGMPRLGVVYSLLLLPQPAGLCVSVTCIGLFPLLDYGTVDLCLLSPKY